MKRIKIFSMIQLLIPIISAFIMTFFEKEKIEAILSGLVIGWIISACMGSILLIINRKYKSDFVKATSIVAIFPICIFIMLFLVAMLYRI